MAAWIAPTAMMYLNIVGLGIAPVAHLALFAVAVRMATASRTESEGATAGSRSPAMAAAAS
jgi:hypothetical protein